MDVPEAFDKDSEDKIPILEEVAEKAIDAKGPLAGRPPHVIIEGDNYHALTCLNYTHRGKIDVIYIDPPYNTGSDGFTYKDKRFLTEFPDGQKVPKEHPLRHSYWLSFMEKRLKLAKNLLSDKGVIFISIDDNEQANLKLLCDKIFGEENFGANIIWEKADSPRMDAKDFSSKHDYILCYCRNISTEPIRKIKTTSVPEHYNKIDSNGRKYYLKPLRYMGNADSRTDRPNMFYPIIAPDGTEVFPIKADGSEGRWRWGKDKYKENLNRLDFTKTKKGWSVNTKIYAEEETDVPVETIWYNKDVESNRNAIATVKKIFGEEKVFSNPKPIALLQRIIQISSTGTCNPIILDFFAGSGTTLHATLNLNKEDDGNRQCILVQQAEGDNNICENVTYERNRRVMCGYTNAKGENVEGLGGSLKYYKTGFVGKHQSKNANDADKVELAEKAGCLIALAENTLDTIKVPEAAKGFWQIYSDNAEKKKRYTCIYHNGDYGKVSDFVAKIDELRATDKKSKFTVYVFSWNSPDFFENEFDDLKNIEIKAIPKPILEIYKALNG